MTKSVDVLDQVFLKTGYHVEPCMKSWKIFDEIAIYLPQGDTERYHYYYVKTLSFVDEHLSSVLGRTLTRRQTEVKEDQARRIVTSLRRVEIDNNPLKSKKMVGIY